MTQIVPHTPERNVYSAAVRYTVLSVGSVLLVVLFRFSTSLLFLTTFFFSDFLLLPERVNCCPSPIPPIARERSVSLYSSNFALCVSKLLLGPAHRLLGLPAELSLLSLPNTPVLILVMLFFRKLVLSGLHVLLGSETPFCLFPGFCSVPLPLSF